MTSRIPLVLESRCDQKLPALDNETIPAKTTLLGSIVATVNVPSDTRSKETGNPYCRTSIWIAFRDWLPTLEMYKANTCWRLETGGRLKVRMLLPSLVPTRPMLQLMI